MFMQEVCLEVVSDGKKQIVTSGRGKQPRAGFKSWLGSWQEWVSVVLLLLTLGITTRSLEYAQWITPQPSLTGVLAVAVLVGLLLAKSRLPAILTSIIAIVLGIIVTVWQVFMLLPTLVAVSKINQLQAVISSFWQAASLANPSENPAHLAIFLVLFTWVMGYISTWFVLRRHNAWVGITLGMVAILINLNNLTPYYYRFFFFYLLAAMLLLAQTNLTSLWYWLRGHQAHSLRRITIPFMAIVLGLSLLGVSAAWFTPDIRVSRTEVLANVNLLGKKQIEAYVANFLAAVPAKQPFLRSEDQKVLLLGSPFESDDDVHFVVTAPKAFHWRVRMYDTYNSWGWTGSNATVQTLRQSMDNILPEKPSQRAEMSYSVYANLRTDILLTVGEFISADVPTSVQTLNLPSFNINLSSPGGESAFPADVASLARSLRAAQTKKQLSIEELTGLLPADLALTGIAGVPYSLSEDSDASNRRTLDIRQLTNIQLSRVRSGAGDAVTVTSPSFIKLGQRYTATGSISTAIPAELSRAGSNYTAWISDYYLQVPSTLPQRVRQLSAEVTREAKSPYEKARAIERYLGQLRYALEFKAPPQGADGVDHFLFVQQSGNCVYFASAMAVMLRSVGIPTRLAIGYLPGEWDEGLKGYVVRGKHYHAWPEVYFPGYGWIDFDPTPATPGGIETVRHASGGAPADYSEDEESFILSEGSSGTVSPRTTRQPLSRELLYIFFGLVLAGLMAFAVRATYRSWLRRLVGTDYASEVYFKMCFLAALTRLRPKPQQTPLEYSMALVTAFPQQAEALYDIAGAYLESRYSPRKEIGLERQKELKQAWRKVYPVFLKRLFRLKH